MTRANAAPSFQGLGCRRSSPALAPRGRKTQPWSLRGYHSLVPTTGTRNHVILQPCVWAICCAAGTVMGTRKPVGSKDRCGAHSCGD